MPVLPSRNVSLQAVTLNLGAVPIGAFKYEEEPALNEVIESQSRVNGDSSLPSVAQNCMRRVSTDFGHT